MGILVILGFAIAVLTDTISIPWFEVHGVKKILSLFVVLLSFVVVISIPNLISSFKWSGFQKKSLWDWLQLLVVPLMLAFGAFYLNYSSTARDKELADKRQQQEIVKDYFSKMQTLILAKKESPSKSKTNTSPRILSPELRPIAQALTFAVLDEVEGIQKGQVIAYLAEAGLIRQPEPEILLYNANLKGIVLKDLKMDKVRINSADMTEATMTNVIFKHSDIGGSILRDSTLNNVNFNADFMEPKAKTNANKVNFAGSIIINGTFTNTDLTGSNFDGATLKNITEDKIILKSPFSDACFSSETKIEDKENWLKIEVDKLKSKPTDRDKLNIIGIEHGGLCDPLVSKTENLNKLEEKSKTKNLNKIKPPS